MKPAGRRQLIAVIGASNASAAGEQCAYQVGKLIAAAGAVLVTGGLGGVMAAASRGCAEAGGEVIGILPGASAAEANPYVTIPIVTNMGHARNVIIAHSADGLIAVEGEYGTLSEMAISLKLRKPLVQLNSWTLAAEVPAADTAQQAVEMILQMLAEGDEDDNGAVC